MAEEAHPPSGQSGECGCFAAPGQFLVHEQELGMDEHYAEVSLLVCGRCGQRWLRYFYEIEAFTSSGRWYLGAISQQQSMILKAGEAKALLESLDWYFYGGSYYGGRSGKASGRIYLSP